MVYRIEQVNNKITGNKNAKNECTLNRSKLKKALTIVEMKGDGGHTPGTVSPCNLYRNGSAFAGFTFNGE